MTSKVKALLLGGTGETGKRVLQELLKNDQVSKLILIGRREMEITDEKVEQRVIDFEKLSEHKEAFEGADIAFCCLGTTRGKAGKAGFVRVDLDYVVDSAQLLKDCGCKDYHLLSSMGANANAFALYTQTKGKAEEKVKEMGFDRVAVYRPGVLLVEREENRYGERVVRCLAPYIDWGQRMSIKIEDVARAMVTNSLKTSEASFEIFENGDIIKMAK